MIAAEGRGKETEMFGKRQAPEANGGGKAERASVADGWRQRMREDGLREWEAPYWTRSGLPVKVYVAKGRGANVATDAGDTFSRFESEGSSPDMKEIVGIFTESGKRGIEFADGAFFIGAKGMEDTEAAVAKLAAFVKDVADRKFAK